MFYNQKLWGNYVHICVVVITIVHLVGEKISLELSIFRFSLQTENHTLSHSLTSSCNTDCGCSMSLYDPVCADGIQYFTPCHAGCSQPAVENKHHEKVCNMNRFDTVALFRDALISIDILLTVTP